MNAVPGGVLPRLEGPVSGECEQDWRDRCARNHLRWARVYDELGYAKNASACRDLAADLVGLYRSERLRATLAVEEEK